MNDMFGTRHQISRSRGIDVVRVDQVHVDGEGYTITGTDQYGRKLNDLRMSIHESPVIIPENGEMVVVERNNNVPYAIRGKGLTEDQIRSLDLQPGDFAIVGHKRVFVFCDEFLVRNRSILDEFTDGGGQNLLENSGFQRLNTPTILAEKFGLTQGVFNTVAWDTSGIAGQDGSFIFTMNRPDDPVSIDSKVSHTIVEGTYTLSTYMRTGNWADDTVYPNSTLYVVTSREDRESLARTTVAMLTIAADETALEGGHQAYVDGAAWFRPYGYVDVPPEPITDAERYVVTFGMQVVGHYKRQLDATAPDPKLWIYSPTTVLSGVSDMTVSANTVFCGTETWSTPSLIDFEVTQQVGEAAMLLTAFIDVSNYEGLEITPGTARYVRVTNGKRNVLDTMATTVAGGSPAFYRLHTMAGNTTISAGSTRGNNNLGSSVFASGFGGGRVGVKTTGNSLVVTSIDVFQPYTTQIDNVQLERGVSLSGWEGSTNEQTNVDDLLNQINDIPEDGSTIIADRIGAGTIAGRRIYVVNKPVTGSPIPGRAGVIQSSNFDAVNPSSFAPRDGSSLSDVVNPAIVGASNKGWLILGNGQAWFQDVFISGNLSVGGHINTSDGSTLIDDGNVNGDNMVFSKNIFDQDNNTYARTMSNSAYRFITGSAKTHIGTVDRPSYGMVVMSFLMRFTPLAGNSTDDSDYLRAQIYYGTSANSADGQGTPAGGEIHQWLSGVGNVRSGATDNYAVVKTTAAGGPPYDEGLDGDPRNVQYILLGRLVLNPGTDYYVFPKFSSVHLNAQKYTIDQYNCQVTVQGR